MSRDTNKYKYKKKGETDRRDKKKRREKEQKLKKKHKTIDFTEILKKKSDNFKRVKLEPA